MKRLDVALVDAGLVASRARAQTLITDGAVGVDGVIAKKSSAKVSDDAIITLLKHDLNEWVSRGALKLVHAIEHFSPSLKDKRCLDIGASTGGFTEVLLKHGAKHVMAVDVGHDQLDATLKNHPQVTSVEGCNARYIDADIVPNSPELIVCDASFISLKLILPAAMGLAADNAELIALIKPQFEIGKDSLPKDGVVKKPAAHKRICDDITAWFKQDMGWHVRGITESPITGPKGNVEFLIYCSKVAA